MSIQGKRSRRVHLCSTRREYSRREWLRMAAWGTGAAYSCGWLPELAARAAFDPARRRSCIVLWMSGGPSQLDTFDLKSDHENGGEFSAIETSVPGIRISEHLPQLAKVMQHVVPIRSMSTKEGDHSRGSYTMRTGQSPQGPVHYPSLGSVVCKQLGTQQAELPSFISIAPNRFQGTAAYGSGFLGPKYAPLVVGDARPANVEPDPADVERSLRVRNLQLADGLDIEQADARLSMLRDLEQEYASQRPGRYAVSHQTAYDKAVRMMRSKAVEAFSLDGEPDKLRDAYGRNRFGQGCLLARRLIERNVPFVEVSLNGLSTDNRTFTWDSHQDNFASVRSLSQVLDPAWATLISDLENRGLLESTLVVWMGEFGRTPRINRSTGRDHFPAAWSTVLAGGGIRGGQTVGETSVDGTEVKERPVSEADFLATIYQALGIDPHTENVSNVGRPIALVDSAASPIEEILL